MQVTLDVSKLKNGVDILTKLTKSSKKGSDPRFSNIQLSFKKGFLYLYSSDGVSSGKFTYGEVSCEDGDFLIESSSFNNVVQFSHTNDLQFDFGAKSLVINDKGNPYRFNYLGDASSHLDILHQTIDDSVPCAFQIKHEDLKRIIQSLDSCMGKDSARPFLKGLYYDGNFVTADGNTCGYKDNHTVSNTKFLIPLYVLPHILSLEDKCDTYVYVKDPLLVVRNKIVEYPLG
jgi:DNA polymerase III sliding clamp (beta) subunit (PCNA family)